MLGLILRNKKLWAPLLGLVLLFLMGTARVSAHARLIQATPAPGDVLPEAPNRVQLWFDESVDSQFSEVRVLNAAGTRLDYGQLEASGDGTSVAVSLVVLSDGAYTVIWKVFSATDGHITRGVYSFAVGKAGAGAGASLGAMDAEGGQATPLAVIAKAAELIGLLVLVGGFFFRLLLLDTSLRGIGTDPALVDARWLYLEAIGLATALAGTAVELWLEVKLVADEIALQPAAEVLFDTRWGALWLLRIFSLIACGTILFAKRRRIQIAVPAVTFLVVLALYAAANMLSLTRGLFLASLVAPAGETRAQQIYLYLHHFGLFLPFALFFGVALYQNFRLRGLLPLLGMLALATLSLSAHGAAAQGDLSLASVSDWMHLLAVAVWIGGLVHFAWVMPLLKWALGPQPRSRWIAWTLPQFSKAAIAATATIAVTGAYNALVEVPALGRIEQLKWPLLDPSDSSYLYPLLGKVALFGVMIAIGAVNLLFLSQRFRQQVLPQAQSDRLLGFFRITMGAEVCLGLAAIVLAGIMTLEPPARTSAAIAARENPTPVSVSMYGEAGPDVRIRLSVTEGDSPVGAAAVARASIFDARVTDAYDRPIADVLRVIFTFTSLDYDSGVQRVAAEPQADSHFVVTGNYVPLAGRWRIGVIVRRRGVEDVQVDLIYAVRPDER